MEDYKKAIKETFDKVSSGYDNKNLRFFQTSAKQMIELIELKGTETVLDIAAGTGYITIEAAKKLKNGKVHSTDISDKMLEKIKEKAVLHNLNNISFEIADLESIAKDLLFDAATCGFGIFFINDMLKGLKQIKSNIRPGGKLIITTFNENFLYPLSHLFYNRLESYGIEKTSSLWENINTVEKTRGFLELAGLNKIKVIKKQHGYFLENTDAWWQVIWNAGMRRAFERLPQHLHEQFIKEHLAEVNKLVTEKGIWMDVEVIFAMGRV